jgi:hypothetical protein
VLSSCLVQLIRVNFGPGWRCRGLAAGSLRRCSGARDGTRVVARRAGISRQQQLFYLRLIYSSAATDRSPAPVPMPCRAYTSLDNVGSHMELPSAMTDICTCQAVSFQAAGVLSRCTDQGRSAAPRWVGAAYVVVVAVGQATLGKVDRRCWR